MKFKYALVISFVLIILIVAIILLASGSPTYKGNFEDITKQIVQKATLSPRAVFPSSGEVKFNADEIYPSSIFETASNSQDVVFESDLCGDSSAVCSIDENGAFIVNRKFSSYLTVCCTAQTGGVCKIGIGKNVSC